MDRIRTSNPSRGLGPPWIRPYAPLALLALLALSCGGPAKGPESAPARGEWRTFEGTGSSSGKTQALRLGSGRYVAILNLTGSLLLTGEQWLGKGFRSETIGFTDSLKGGSAWSVWTDNRGDRIFSELRGGPVGTGTRFKGTILGGTGAYAGMSGEYEFEWQYVVHEEDGTIQGRSKEFRGRFRQEPSPSPQGGSSRGRDGDDHGRA
ncbi:MAG: hypothetical protein WC899_08005 [bacterium]|jgi:hypothetical protein